MISKFATVYAGHIDFPDHGQNATPANERRFTNDQLAGVYDKLETIAKTMDRFGFDTLPLSREWTAAPFTSRSRARTSCGSRPLPRTTSRVPASSSRG